MSIGSEIKKVRQALDYTLRELAEKTNLSISFLSDVERGKRNPSMGNLEQIASALGISASRLMGWDEEAKTEEFDPDIRAIARDMQSLSSGQKDLLKKLIKEMSQRATEELDK